MAKIKTKTKTSRPARVRKKIVKKATRRAARSVRLPVKMLNSHSRRVRISREANRQFAPVLSPFAKPTRRILFKLAAFALVVSMNGLALSRVGDTMGYYNDEESSGGNIFNAGMLDIVLSNADFEGVISNDSSDESQFDNNVSLVAGSLPTQYTVEYEKTGGNDSMCNALALAATHSELSYNGALSTFLVGTTNGLGLWSFVITILSGESVVAGETCEFDLIYKAWVDGASFETSGFSDEERFHISIEAAEAESPVVINEFLPNPDGVLCTDGSDDCEAGDPEFIFDFGRDSDNKPQGEWVELYNLTGSPVDLDGWYVQDASGGVGNTQITNTNTLPATTIIPANGYLVIYMNKPVWNNTGDVVKLFNASDVLQDSYAYTSEYDYCYLTPTPGETNDEDPSGDDIDCTPGATIPGNKSYARIPDGTGSFIDPVPTPGVRNSLDEANAPEELELVMFEMEVATSTEVILEVATSTEVVLEEATSTEPSPEATAGEAEPILEETASSTSEAIPEEEPVVETEEVIVAREEDILPPEPILEETPVIVEESVPIEPASSE